MDDDPTHIIQRLSVFLKWCKDFDIFNPGIQTNFR